MTDIVTEMPMRGMNDTNVHVPRGCGAQVSIITMLHRDDNNNDNQHNQEDWEQRCKERCKFPWFRILLHIAFYCLQAWIVWNYNDKFALILPAVQGIGAMILIIINCQKAPPNTHATFLHTNSLIVSFIADLIAPPVYLILMSVDVVTYDKQVMYNCIGLTSGAWGVVVLTCCCLLEGWIHSSSSTPPPLRAHVIVHPINA
jgi:hypothetical protein